MFLSNVLFHLKKNGHLIVNVPSINMLYSKYDKAVGHIRRYNKFDFIKIKKELKFKIVKLEYWGLLLLPFLVLRKLIMMIDFKNDHNKIIKNGWEANQLLNVIMKFVMKLELFIFDKQVLGSSLMIVIRK